MTIKMYYQRLILRSQHILHIFLSYHYGLAWAIFVSDSFEIFFWEILSHLHSLQLIWGLSCVQSAALGSACSLGIGNRVVDVVTSFTQASVIHMDGV